MTLLCFLLASTMAIGITVYVDSYSVHEWEKNIDVGEIAISVRGWTLEQSYVDDIREIGGVTKAAALRSGHGYLELIENNTLYLDMWGDILTPDEEFYETFPNYINLEQGRMPENTSEIAIIYAHYTTSQIELGDVLELHLDDNQDMIVVGFYSHEGEADSPYFWSYSSIGIVVPSVVIENSADIKILVDVDRSGLSAFNPTGTLQFLNGIDESIRLLDPAYDPVTPWSGNWYVQNRLSTGVNAYISWVLMLRFIEMFRASSVLFLLVLVNFLAIRHNVNERRYEENMLISRGAAKGDLEKATTREIFILAILSCFIGIPLGLLLSRVAMAATGFFIFNPALFFSEPILISLDSLLISAVVTIALPMLTLGGYRAVYSTKKSVDEDRGKLAKLSKGLGLIRWDVMIVVLSGLFLLALTGSNAAASNPLLSLILPIIPLPLFLGISSITMKALRWGAYRLSKAMRRLVGEVPSSIGIRRVGKGASSAGAAAMILVLAICLSWNSAIIDASMPVTAQNQSRLSVGSDLTFALDENQYGSWDDFITNVTNHELVESSTIVSEARLYLSAGYGGGANFLAVNPREYTDIGYDYLGNPLNVSDISLLLDNLETSPDGAIITTDIAQSYSFEVGDILRASTLEENAIPIVFRIIGITDAIPEVPDRYGYPIGPVYFGFGYQLSPVGTTRILVNREFLGSQLTLLNNSYNFLCVRTAPYANSSAIVEDVFEGEGNIAVYENRWESVSQNVQDYVSATQYLMERSLDTMLTVLTVGTIVGGFAIYAVEGVRARRREIALLRSVGASKRMIIMVQGAEMLVLILVSMILLLIYAPLFLSTSINLAGGSTTGYYDTYLVSIFPVIPWTTIFVVLGFFVVSVALFIFVIAALSSRINLASTLNAAWAEAGPYGDDM